MTRGNGKSPVRDALGALEAAGVAWCIRNSPERVDDLPPGSDVDVVIESSGIAVAGKTLREQGFEPFLARGHRGHHFFIACDRGHWTKLDLMTDPPVLARRQLVDGLWVASDHDLAAHRSARAIGRPVPSLATRMTRALPLSLRRRGPVVAMLGPDGAGKGTVIDALVTSIPVGVTVVRLGTSRTGPANVNEASRPPVWREVLFVVRKWLISGRRLAGAYVAAWRGHIVLCDRHPLEILAVRPTRGAVAGAVERRLLSRALPKPDAVIVLDAPTEVLIARKPEHPPGVITAWRTGFRALPGARVIDAEQPVAATVEAASSVVFDALTRRRGW